MPYYPVSSRFEAALLASHQVATQVDAYYNGVLVQAGIPIVDGTVTVDRGSAVRRSLTLTVADTRLLPWSATDTLAPYGQQLVVRCGIVLGATTEWIPVGTFTIDSPGGDADGLDALTLTGGTSEVLLQDAPFTAATTTRGYPDCVTAITALIRAVLPAAVVVNLTGDGRNPTIATTTWDAGTDRWDAVTQIAAAMSADIGCDALDRFVITDTPDPATATTWDWDVTYAGTLITDTRQMQRTGVYNGVLVTAGVVVVGGDAGVGVVPPGQPDAAGGLLLVPGVGTLVVVGVFAGATDVRRGSGGAGGEFGLGQPDQGEAPVGRNKPDDDRCRDLARVHAVGALRHPLLQLVLDFRVHLFPLEETEPCIHARQWALSSLSP